MLPQAFSMVRQQNDQRPVPPSLVDQGFLEGAQQPVDVFDLGIVAGDAAPPGLGLKLIGLVQVEQVNKSEDGPIAVLGEPLGGRPRHQGPVPSVPHGVRVLVGAEEHGAGQRRQRLELEGAVINVEALVKAHLAFQEDTAQESGGLVALPL